MISCLIEWRNKIFGGPLITSVQGLFRVGSGGYDESVYVSYNENSKHGESFCPALYLRHGGYASTGSLLFIRQVHLPGVCL